ncbi:hypothetical protein MVEN_00273600 [Mycena venus]|uniref:Uncharacterized protein n=1 Tax=Mycena venus TaxID=2733690 RepID=A0A8H6Z2G2_9AGAR|nr:hypothetical protein MVEN_00273600 [Mycena venus]
MSESDVASFASHQHLAPRQRFTTSFAPRAERSLKSAFFSALYPSQNSRWFHNASKSGFSPTLPNDGGSKFNGNLQFPAFLSTLHNLISAIRAKPPSSFQQAVRHLLLLFDDYQPIEVILSVCTGVENFSFRQWIEDLSIPLILALPRKRLCANRARRSFALYLRFTNLIRC